MMSGILTFIKRFRWLGPAVTALGSAVAAVLVGAWAVTTYLHRAQLDYSKEFNAKQVSTLLLAAETAGNLVATIDFGEWTRQQEIFWRLHWGGLVVFENQEIECAMTYLGAKLNVTEFGERRKLGPEAFALSNAVRKSIEQKIKNGWKIDLPTLVGARAIVEQLLQVKGADQEGVKAYPALVDKIEEKCRSVLRAPTRPPQLQ
jgi:hypothetical protein